MKRFSLYLLMLGLALALVGPASAVTIGTMSGTGSVTVDKDTNTPLAYSFFGAFNFDNTTSYATPLGNQTLKTIMGDVGQYTFAANSSATIAANDWNSVGTDPAISKGSFNWVLNNTTGPDNATLYGNEHNFIFVYIPGPPDHGTLTGTVKSFDGNVHWYYGYDTDSGGMTSLAAFGLSDTFNFIGDYTVTGGSGATVNYSLTGTFYGNPVPIPGALVLLGAGLVRLAAYGRRKRALA